MQKMDRAFIDFRGEGWHFGAVNFRHRQQGEVLYMDKKQKRIQVLVPEIRFEFTIHGDLRKLPVPDKKLFDELKKSGLGVGFDQTLMQICLQEKYVVGLGHFDTERHGNVRWIGASH